MEKQAVDPEQTLFNSPSKCLVWYHDYELTRLHKWPLGNILIFWPCAWAILMAARIGRPSVQNLVIQTLMFAVGSTLLHSAACVINDICDRDLDRQVERTKNRPLAAGVLPTSGAWALLAFLVASSLCILSVANSTAFFYGIFGIFPLHALYPLMKRWTWWPQAWLGLAMNWGFPVAWLSMTGSTDDIQVPVTMFIGLVCWTIVYDTIYACQDVKDDLKAGVKSTALLFGPRVRVLLAIFAAAFLCSLITAGILNCHGIAYFVISCGGAAIHLFWQLANLQIEDATDCGAKFKSNGDMGYIIWVGLLLDHYLQF